MRRNAIKGAPRITLQLWEIISADIERKLLITQSKFTKRSRTLKYASTHCILVSNCCPSLLELSAASSGKIKIDDKSKDKLKRVKIVRYLILLLSPPFPPSAPLPSLCKQIYSICSVAEENKFPVASASYCTLKYVHNLPAI